jgi:hypothetical protein
LLINEYEHPGKRGQLDAFPGDLLMTVTLDQHTHLKLETALIAFDDRNRKAAVKSKLGRGHYNPHALAIYLRGFAAMKEEVRAGEKTLAQGLYDHFNGRLLSALERSVGLPVTYGGGPQSAGRPTY